MRRTLLVAGVLLLGAVSTVGVLATTESAARTAEGTTLGALDLSGLDRAELRARLTAVVDSGPDAVVVHLGTTRATVPAEDLGIRVDVDETVDRLLAQSGDARRWGLLPAGRGRDVGPVLEVDDSQLDATVERLRDAGTRPATDGSVVWDSRAGVLRPALPRPGQSVEAAAIENALQAAAARVPLAGDVVVPVTPVPTRVQAADVQAAVTRGNALLADPPLLRSGKAKAQVSARDLGPLLGLRTVDAGVELGLMPTPAQELADDLAEELSIDPVEPELDAPVAKRLFDDKGDAIWDPVPAEVKLVSLGKPGQDVAAADVLQALQRLESGTIAISSTVAPPRATAAGVNRIDSVLGTFTTYFQCCQPRVRNIGLMAETLDETLVPAGSSFSINDIVGPRTKAKGYVDAPYIFEGELSTDIGGGVSQVGTTTLNAAFFAGLRLDEHKAHSFYISRYPAGREATLNYPDLDVRWTNTTSAPIFVRTTATSTSITVTLYGHDDGRRVEAIAGERQQVKGRDFRIRITRLIHLANGTVRRDGFTTTYNKPPEGH